MPLTSLPATDPPPPPPSLDIVTNGLVVTVVRRKTDRATTSVLTVSASQPVTIDGKVA